MLIRGWEAETASLAILREIFPRLLASVEFSGAFPPSGRQPPAINLQQIMEMDIPMSWNEQRQALNWPAGT